MVCSRERSRFGERVERSEADVAEFGVDKQRAGHSTPVIERAEIRPMAFMIDDGWIEGGVCS